jgi:hypothetical protein
VARGLSTSLHGLLRHHLLRSPTQPPISGEISSFLHSDLRGGIHARRLGDATLPSRATSDPTRGQPEPPPLKYFPPSAEVVRETPPGTAARKGNPSKGIDVTTKDDVTKVLAVRRAFDAGAERANSGRWSATRQERLEANARRILRAILEREPTADEVAAAMGDDDEMSALGRLNEAAAANGPTPAP